MKAIVCESYGGPEVLIQKEVNKPSIKSNEVLIKVKATAVNSADWRLRKADPWAVRLFFGFKRPKYPILGGVLAGEIVEIGSSVSNFKIGDAVFASTALKYGFGAYAEYKSLPENGIITLKPSNLTMNESASLPFGGITAHYFIEKAQLKPGQKILINGVSGAVGVILLQLAKLKGVHVTGICSAKNADKIKSLGADEVIDYNKKSITQINQQFEVVFNTIEKQDTIELMKLLSPSGKLVLVAASLNQLFKSKFRSIFSSQKVFGGMSVESLNSLEVICDLAEKNMLKPIIDRVYKLSEIQEAHAYVEKGHKLGNVVVEI